MKRFFAALAFVVALAFVSHVAPPRASLVRDARAQSTTQSTGTPDAARSADGATKSAAALYEEAAGYTRRKFDEFGKQNVPYSEELRDKTLREQKELAARHASALAARGELRGLDLYYLGRLHDLADQSDGALEALRRFLAAPTGASPEVLQDARAAFVQYAVKPRAKDASGAVPSLPARQVEEAERVLAEFAAAKPAKPATRYALETVVAKHYHDAKLYEPAVAHAREAYNAAVRLARDGGADAARRDQMIYNAAARLGDSLGRLNRKSDALAALEDARRVALALPSARLFANVSEMIESLGGADARPAADVRAPGVVEASSRAAAAASPASDALMSATAPEFVASEWVGRQPVKLSELRGQVVLLDFWATWCTPCVVTMPKLNALQRRYASRGLVVIGLTELYGQVNRRPVTPAAELASLHAFRGKHGLDYGFAVADSHVNDAIYGVGGTIPTVVLIDRRGRVRHFVVGVYRGSDEELNAFVRRLLDEK
ncbi:MAG TPA: TlpA disulfide reductase family protein [Pyrinomonadaceae bacterium]|nr:TlpA disulfide reductase family protein [Pyrinomonadaceae bacterium]